MSSFTSILQEFCLDFTKNLIFRTPLNGCSWAGCLIIVLFKVPIFTCKNILSKYSIARLNASSLDSLGQIVLTIAIPNWFIMVVAKITLVYKLYMSNLNYWRRGTREANAAQDSQKLGNLAGQCKYWLYQ